MLTWTQCVVHIGEGTIKCISSFCESHWINWEYDEGIGDSWRGFIGTESDVKPVDQLSPKERRKLRNERREALKEEKGSWKEQVETKLDVKKKPLKGWDQILDINRLASKGYVWYMVSTPKKAEHEAAEQLHIQFAQMFPGMKYEVRNLHSNDGYSSIQFGIAKCESDACSWVFLQVLTPSIPSFRKLKSGRYSDSRVRLYPGCLLIRCVMNRDVYNMIRSNLRIYNFFGTKAQGTRCLLHTTLLICEIAVIYVYRSKDGNVQV